MPTYAITGAAGYLGTRMTRHLLDVDGQHGRADRRVIVSEYILFAVFALILLVFLLGAAKNSSAVLYVELGIVASIGERADWAPGQAGREQQSGQPDGP